MSSPIDAEVKSGIRKALKDQEVWNLVLPYVSARVTGHKVMDLLEAVNIILDWDKELNCGQIASSNITKWQLGNKLKAVMREVFILDDDWKIRRLKDN